MLTFTDRRPQIGRRAFCARALSLGGLSLPSLLAHAAAEPKRLLTGRSVIFLFLHGGPSQFETFDPKMSAPGRNPVDHRRDRHQHSGRDLRLIVSQAGAAGRSIGDRPFVHDRRRQPRHQAGRQPAYARRQPGLTFRARRGSDRSGDRHAAHGLVVASRRRSEHWTRADQIWPVRFDRFSRRRVTHRSCRAPAATCSRTWRSICRSIV